ncbi:hypothetical protein M0R72_06420 [Candidatus Pacearchaeota archaeon]|jgi:hypothetical protein|nr:hypothetical protein [Candidatus Pacearchaeota archaeon]
MAKILRKIDGEWIALCPNSTDPKMGDVYLSDPQSYALSLYYVYDEGPYNKRFLSPRQREEILRDVPTYVDEWRRSGCISWRKNPEWIAKYHGNRFWYFIRKIKVWLFWSLPSLKSFLK